MCIDQGTAGRPRTGRSAWRHSLNKATTLAAGLLVVAAAADLRAAESAAEAMTSGKAHVNLRYRYEWVEQDRIAEEANASTIRLRLNYATGMWRGWSGFAEFDHVTEVLADNFNSGGGTTPGRAEYPVVADSTGSDLNQVYVQFQDPEAWKLRLGRQRILLDNQRFVGGVGWRQNEQTYDGVSLTLSSWAKTRLFYSYVINANRIFGDDVPAGDHEQDTHLLNIHHQLNDAWNVVGYGYFIDNEDAIANSTATFGARATGSLEFATGKLKLVGELATQSDAADGPVDYDAGYGRLEATWQGEHGFSIGIGYESLGGDSANAGEAFRTPLATLHAFNGWSDRFLATPDAGLEDLFFSASFGVAGWKFTSKFHDFSAESGSGDYGTEFDFAAARTFAKRYKLLLKYASFNADDPAFADTTKIWAMLTAGY